MATPTSDSTDLCLIDQRPESIYDCLERLLSLPRTRFKIRLETHTNSFWSHPFKLTVTTEGSNAQIFFLKKTSVDLNHNPPSPILGATMVHGEYVSMSTIYNATYSPSTSPTPAFCPKPLGYGLFTDASGNPEKDPKNPEINVHYFLCQFLHMATRLGDATTQMPAGIPDNHSMDKNQIMLKFCHELAKMHFSTPPEITSFGFGVTTCNGNIPQKNDWQPSWTTFFTEGLKHMLSLHTTMGLASNENIETYSTPFLEIVVPRLLDALTANGRTLKPSLIHGDLWNGNTALLVGEEIKTVIFDACCVYGHNEYELGNWTRWPERNGMSEYVKMYLKAVGGASEPKEEFDDRNRLYSMKFNMHAAVLFPQKREYIDLIGEDMKFLVEKYGTTPS